MASSWPRRSGRVAAWRGTSAVRAAMRAIDTAETGTTTRKTRTTKTPEERAAEIEALAEQLTDAVAQLTTSEAWLRMLRRHGFEVLDLIEVQAPADAEAHTYYDFVTPDGQGYAYTYGRFLQDLFVVDGLRTADRWPF